MKKLILAGIAATTLIAGGAAMTQPAHAQMQCLSGPLGILRTCTYIGPVGGPLYVPPPPPYYSPPPPPYYYGPYWHY
jgi:hypothetical protein